MEPLRGVKMGLTKSTPPLGNGQFWGLGAFWGRSNRIGMHPYCIYRGVLLHSSISSVLGWLFLCTHSSGGERTKTSHRLVASSLPDSSQKVCKTLLCYPLQQFAKLSCFFPIEKRCEWAWGKYSPPQDLQRGFWFFEVKVWLKAENQA